jgi:hypothetical protein
MDIIHGNIGGVRDIDRGLTVVQFDKPVVELGLAARLTAVPVLARETPGVAPPTRNSERSDSGAARLTE